MKVDHGALAAIRDRLDRMMYALVDHRLALELPPTMTGFPRYESLRRIVARLDPAHGALFRLFRLGEVVDDDALLAAFGDDVAALRRTGLVVPADGGWRTPGVLVVPAHGLLLVTGTPGAYPTAPQEQSRQLAAFDLSTSFVAAALPGTLGGRRVLDVCSGTGVQALLCAARGATDVVGLELRESAVTIASMNAALNGMAERVRFRRSDMLAALAPGERFDFVVANLPYLPAIRADRRPVSAADIGNSLLWPLLDALPAHLSGTARGVLATWRAAGAGGSTTHQLRAIADRLAAHGCAVSAYVDPVRDTVDGVLDLLRADLGEPGTEEVRALLADVDGFYNQLVGFERRAAGPVPAEPATFGLGRAAVSAPPAPVPAPAR